MIHASPVLAVEVFFPLSASFSFLTPIVSPLVSWSTSCPQDVLEIPKPEQPAKMNVLAFSDSMGYCKNFFANAPEGRISMKKVVENYHTLTQEDVKKLVTEPKKGWDLVVFAVGCDPPRSNSIEDVIEQNTVISRLCLVYNIMARILARLSHGGLFCFHPDKCNYADYAVTPPKFNCKMVVGRLVSFWEDQFSSAMLNFGRVGGLCFLVLLKRSRYFWLSYEIQRAEGSARKIFCLVRGLFHEDTKTHMKVALFGPIAS